MKRSLSGLVCAFAMSLSACGGGASLNADGKEKAAPYAATLSTDTGYRKLAGSSIKAPIAVRGFYVRVTHEHGGWVLDSISRNQLSRNQLQEIFWVSEDKRNWYLAIPSEVAWCDSNASQNIAPYTVCNSQLGSFSKLGAMVSVTTSLGASMLKTKPYSVNKSDAENIVHSIPESELNDAYLKMFKDEFDQRALAKVKLDEQRQEEEQLRLLANKRIEDNASSMRKRVRIGTQTNCGQVFDVRLPMVGVQTMRGTQYIDISKLYGPDADCNFVNGVYVGR